MNWPKDRKRAFLWAAEAFGTPYENRTADQEELTRAGICWAIKYLTGSREIYSWAMETGFPWWGTNRGYGSWTPSCDTQRSVFCSLMAALSDKEFEELGDGT